MYRIAYGKRCVPAQRNYRSEDPDGRWHDVKEPGKTGGQWRILYCIGLPSLVCDFFEVTATIGEGSGETLNRMPVGPHALILADAGHCSVAGIEYVWQRGADMWVRVNPQSFVAYSESGRRFSLCSLRQGRAGFGLEVALALLGSEGPGDAAAS